MEKNDKLGFSTVGGRVRDIDVIRLVDAARAMEVYLAPCIGNMAYAFIVGGKNILWFPFSDPQALQAQPAFCGIPFLAPWANRIDGDTYWVNVKRFLLNPLLAILRPEPQPMPIHGLLSFSTAWALIAAGADELSAFGTS